MNTPTHVVLSIAALTQRREAGDERPTYVLPAALGAIAPDAAMFAFYAIEKLISGSSEREIWTSRYFLPGWQDFFDLFNSIPVIATGMLIAWRLGRPGWLVFFASMLLHVLCDLPLHHDDGHRHFWPLLDWRFESPVSYWDANHYGRPAAIAELALFVGCYVWSFRRHDQWKVRSGLTLLAMIHLSFMAFALMFWAGL